MPNAAVREVVNEVNGAGETPLVAAIMKGNENIIKQLLAAGASLDIADATDRLPLHAACALGNSRIVETLLAAGAKSEEVRPECSTSIAFSGEEEAIPSSEVLLHVYHVGTGNGAKCDFATMIFAFGTTFGGRHTYHSGCGVFHTAIEVLPLSNGLEWSFGQTKKGTGVHSEIARQNPRHEYRESVCLGKTGLRGCELDELILSMKAAWLGSAYHIVSHNCQSFCSALCEALDVKPLPHWVIRSTRLCRAGLAASEQAVRAARRSRYVLRRARALGTNGGCRHSGETRSRSSSFSSSEPPSSVSSSTPSSSAHASTCASPVMFHADIAPQSDAMLPPLHLNQLSLNIEVPPPLGHKLHAAARQSDGASVLARLLQRRTRRRSMCARESYREKSPEYATSGPRDLQGTRG